MGVNGVNQQLSSLTDNFSLLRTGTVTSVNPFFVLVDVGGTVLNAAYVQQSRPLAGDMVCVVRQGASWLVLGTSSATGGNAIMNPSFEELNADGTPAWWTLYQVTNLANWSSIEDVSEAIEGTRLLEVVTRGAAVSTSITYSSAVPAVTGQTVELGVYANGYYPSLNQNTSGVQLRALWFANATDLYPTTSAADTLIDSEAGITYISPADGPMRSLSGTAVVPAATTHMRVGLRTVAAQGAGVHYDWASARVIG